MHHRENSYSVSSHLGCENYLYDPFLMRWFVFKQLLLKAMFIFLEWSCYLSLILECSRGYMVISQNPETYLEDFPFPIPHTSNNLISPPLLTITPRLPFLHSSSYLDVLPPRLNFCLGDAPFNFKVYNWGCLKVRNEKSSYLHQEEEIAKR